jgi:hypothetical protein
MWSRSITPSTAATGETPIAVDGDRERRLKRISVFTAVWGLWYAAYRGGGGPLSSEIPALLRP